MFANKLKPGDEIRVIAPSRSLDIITEEVREIANARLAELGFKVSFGRNVEQIDDFKSSSIESRIEDLHEAFCDPNVKGILTAIGGFNSNQLFDHIDWELIRQNPKVLCGFSDITALSNSIYAKTGLVTYSGPHYSSFGQKLYFDFTLDYFKRCLMSDEPIVVIASDKWSDDHWHADQDNRVLIDNPGHLVINEGRAEGKIVGGNLCTFNLLQGTQYMPDLTDKILFIEDDVIGNGWDFAEFDRNLQSLIHLPAFAGVKGIVIGRFQKESVINDDLLRQIIKSKRELDHLPVLSGVDFGHSDPKITFPIGGKVAIDTIAKSLTIVSH
ncbi:LD-carboxypeptidase [Candidatus Saccharibacteria bacterium]|nr:LD-carboxypeptidase [Candidatus Saccharibacteria bacterium]